MINTGGETLRLIREGYNQLTDNEKVVAYTFINEMISVIKQVSRATVTEFNSEILTQAIEGFKDVLPAAFIGFLETLVTDFETSNSAYFFTLRLMLGNMFYILDLPIDDSQGKDSLPKTLVADFARRTATASELATV